METQIYMIFNAIINCTMLEYLPFGVLQFKYKFNKYYALAGIVLLDFILTLPRTIDGADPHLPTIIIMVIYPPVFAILLFKDPLWKKLLATVGFYIFVMYPLEFVTFFVMKIFWGGSFFEDVYAHNGLYYAGLTLNNYFYFIIMVLLVLGWKRFIDKKKTPHTPVYLAVIFYHSVLFLLWLRIAPVHSTTELWPGLIFEIFGYGIAILIFSFFNQMEQKLETEEKIAALYRQRDFEKEYVKASAQHLEQMKQFQNDCSLQIKKLHEAVQQPDYQTHTRQLLTQSQDKINASRQALYSRHPLINALLSVKKELASQNDIKMEIHCTHSENIGIADIDLCSVLGNLLDNAIEACEKIEKENRKIVIDIDDRSGFMIIKVTNSITPQTSKIKRIGFTTKEDTENHGIGLRMVERICVKYEGRLIFTPLENVISVSAILKKDNNL